jgi:hypothetical protein
MESSFRIVPRIKQKLAENDPQFLVIVFSLRKKVLNFESKG